MEGNYAGIPGNGGLPSGQLQGAMAKQMSLHDEYEHARNEWFESCHDFQRASARRDQAQNRLRDITEKLAGHMQASISDPTQPQPEMPGQNRAFIGR